MNRPPLPLGNLLVPISVRGWVNSRAVVGREDYFNEKFQLHHRESNPRGSPHFCNIHFTLPAYFPSGRKPFDLKRLVIFGFVYRKQLFVYRKQLPHSMNSTSAVLCFFSGTSKLFPGQIFYTDQTGRETFFCSSCFILHCWYLRDEYVCLIQKKYKE